MKRRSFLRTAIGALLAPLAVVRETKVSAKTGTPKLGQQWEGEIYKVESREAVCTGYVIDEQGRKWTIRKPSSKMDYWQLALKPPRSVGEVVHHGDGAYKVESVECLGWRTDVKGNRCKGYKVGATYLRRA